MLVRCSTTECVLAEETVSAHTGQYLQVPVSGPGTSAGGAVLANPLTDQEDSTPVSKAFSFYRCVSTCIAGSAKTRSHKD